MAGLWLKTEQKKFGGAFGCVPHVHVIRFALAPPPSSFATSMCSAALCASSWAKLLLPTCFCHRDFNHHLSLLLNRIMTDQHEDGVATAPAAEEENQSTALATTNSSNEVAAPTEKKVVKKIIRRKRRPARPQVDPSTFSNEPPPQTGTTFNIW